MKVSMPGIAQTGQKALVAAFSLTTNTYIWAKQIQNSD